MCSGSSVQVHTGNQCLPQTEFLVLGPTSSSPRQLPPYARVRRDPSLLETRGSDNSEHPEPEPKP